MKLVFLPLQALDGSSSREFSLLIRELTVSYRWEQIEFHEVRGSETSLRETLLKKFVRLPDGI